MQNGFSSSVTFNSKSIVLERSLRSLSDRELDQATRHQAKQEQAATLDLLVYLKQIEARKVYSLLAYASLWEYCVKGLGYGEGAAAERIAAMRLLKQHPESEEKIRNGELNLGTAAQLQRFFKSEEKSGRVLAAEQKREWIDKASGQSKRSLEKLLADASPVKAVQEKEKIISSILTELKIYADVEFMGMLDRLRELRRKEQSHADLLKLVMAFYLEKKDPMRFAQKARREKAQRKKGGSEKSENSHKNSMDQSKIAPTLQNTPSTRSGEEPKINPAALEQSEALKKAEILHPLKTTRQSGPLMQSALKIMKTAKDKNSSNRTQSEPTPLSDFKIKNSKKLQNKNLSTTETSRPSRYISTAVKKELWLRSGGQCEFYDSLTERRCLCRTHLEVEHSLPYAKGGENTRENLKLYCTNHNRWAAVQAFGTEWMQHYYQS